MTRPAHRALRAALLIAGLNLCGAAAAQMPSQQSPRSIYFALLGGLTFGGESLADVQYSTGERTSVKAGEMVHLGLGLVWQPADIPVSVQGTVGYHFGGAYATNGDVQFTRVPFELLGFYTGIPNWRLGGGVRWVNSPKLTDEVYGVTIDYKPTTGTVLEAGYRLGRVAWLNFRYTDEDYEADRFNGVPVTATGKYAGQSFGINVVFTL